MRRGEGAQTAPAVCPGAGCGSHAMDGEDVVGEIDADGGNGRGLLLSTQTRELMESRSSHRAAWLPNAATARGARDGEVPFIPWGNHENEIH